MSCCVQVKTSPVPAKDPYFATLKSNNYLVNTLALLDAESEGVDQGIFLDAEGRVAEGPNMNVAMITHDGTFVVRRRLGARLSMLLMVAGTTWPAWRSSVYSPTHPLKCTS